MSALQMIGTVYLRPLVGAPHAEHGHPAEILQQAGYEAVREVQSLVQAGCDAVILQNQGDRPYFTSRVPSDTVACMAIIAAAVREAVRVKLGLQVLGNDPKSALAIASVTGCDFIRARVSSDVSLNSIARLLRERERLHSPVGILVDTGNHFLSSVEAITGNGPQHWADGLILRLGGSSDEMILGGPTAEKTSEDLPPVYLELDHESAYQAFQEARPSVSGVILGDLIRKASPPRDDHGVPWSVVDVKRARELIRNLRSVRSRKAAGAVRKGKRKSRKQ